MSIPNTPIDPDKQPALVRADMYQEWRKREGASLVGGVYIKDMKAVEVDPRPPAHGGGGRLKKRKEGGGGPPRAAKGGGRGGRFFFPGGRQRKPNPPP